MKQAHRRLLAARGLELGQQQKFNRLLVFEAVESTGHNVLAIRSSFLGPSWPSVVWALSRAEVEIKIIEAIRVWVIAPDSPLVRGVLEQLSALAKVSARDLVLVPEVGFVSTGVDKRFEPRVLIGPSVVLLAILTLSFWPIAPQEDQTAVVSEANSVSCVLDLESRELKDWISSTISANQMPGSGSLVIQEDLALLNLEVGQVLGSTQEISGYLECQDGRKQNLHYRVDASASGTLVPLVQKLDP
jgi:hypothetical protein